MAEGNGAGPAPTGESGAAAGPTTGPVDMQGVLDEGSGRDAVGANAAPGTDIGQQVSPQQEGTKADQQRRKAE